MEREFIIDFFLSSHLGDALCSTPVARQAKAEYDASVQVVRHRSTLSVFQHNPYVSKFTTKRGAHLFSLLSGVGHMIQRLQRGLHLPVESCPKPEIYISGPERFWAVNERKKWGGGRICLFSPDVITNAPRYQGVNWTALARAWGEECILVQAVISSPNIYREQIGILRRPQEWYSWGVMPRAVIYRDLTVRQYLSLFSVADYFCGGLAGGAHAAAAHDVPSLIVVWDELYHRLKFPSVAAHLSPVNWAYPYHKYLPCSALKGMNFSRPRIKRAINLTMDATGLESLPAQA